MEFHVCSGEGRGADSCPACGGLRPETLYHHVWWPAIGGLGTLQNTDYTAQPTSHCPLHFAMQTMILKHISIYERLFPVWENWQVKFVTLHHPLSQISLFPIKLFSRIGSLYEGQVAACWQWMHLIFCQYATAPLSMLRLNSWRINLD